MRTIQNICLDENDRQAIVAAAETLRDTFAIERVELFGSKARGEDQDESDIDLLVLTRFPVTPMLKRQITHSLFDIQLQYDVVLSTMIVPLEQWEMGVYRVLPIRNEIERDGVAA